MNKDYIGWSLDKNQNLLHIEHAKSGANGYYCLVCHKELIAKKGEVNAYHFAHKEQSEHVSESVLHLLAKQVLSNLIKQSRLTHPQEYSVTYTNNKKDISTRNVDLEECALLSDITKIQIEESFDTQLRPDLLLTNENGVNIALEVYVTNKKDKLAIQRFKEKSLSALEFNLSDLDWNSTLEEIESALLMKSNQKWLFISKELLPNLDTLMNNDVVVNSEVTWSASWFKEDLSWQNTLLTQNRDDFLESVSRQELAYNLTPRMKLRALRVVKEFDEVAQGVFMAEIEVTAFIEYTQNITPTGKKTILKVYAIAAEDEFTLKNDGKPFILMTHRFDNKSYSKHSYITWANMADWEERAYAKLNEHDPLWPTGKVVTK